VFEFQINNLSSLLDRFTTLPSKVQKKGLDGSARAAMRPVQNAARAAAKAFDDPNSPKKVWRKIVTQKATRSSRRVGGTVMRVGVIGGAKDSGGAESSYAESGSFFYWRFREFGTEKQAADPFMRKAFLTNIPKVQAIFADRIQKVIDRQAAAGGPT
jgi:HK97 gp10 family phage protein